MTVYKNALHFLKHAKTGWSIKAPAYMVTIKELEKLAKKGCKVVCKGKKVTISA